MVEGSTIQYKWITIRVNEGKFCLHCMVSVLFLFKTIICAFTETLLAKSITGNVAICQAFFALFLYSDIFVNT
jgi:hypothetical protein